jgi:hypothetical protein
MNSRIDNILYSGMRVVKEEENGIYVNKKIIDYDKNTLFVPRENETFYIYNSKDNQILLEIRNKETNKKSYKQFEYRNRPNHKSFQFIAEFPSAPIKTTITDNDTFLVFNVKHYSEDKQVMYSVKRKQYITPKVDFIEKIEDSNDFKYFIFEDIHYLKEYDRENHVYGYLDKNGSYTGKIYNYHTNEEIECDITKFPNYFDYYILKRKLNKEFEKDIEKEFGKSLTKVRK